MDRLGSALVDYLQTLEAFVGIEGQHELVFNGKANALACASGAHFSIATVSAEDAVPENDVTTVVGICLAALVGMVAMVLLCGSKEPVPHRHGNHREVGMVKFAVPHTEGC